MNKKTFEEYMTEFNPDWKQILPFNIIKKAKYLYLGVREKADEPFQTGGNGKTFPDEI